MPESKTPEPWTTVKSFDWVVISIKLCIFLYFTPYYCTLWLYPGDLILFYLSLAQYKAYFQYNN